MSAEEFERQFAEATRRVDPKKLRKVIDLPRVGLERLYKLNGCNSLFFDFLKLSTFYPISLYATTHLFIIIL